MIVPTGRSTVTIQYSKVPLSKILIFGLLEGEEGLANALDVGLLPRLYQV